MDTNPIILDISSDEDFGWDDKGDDHFAWIAEFLDSVDSDNGESDEVIIVGEVAGRSASRKHNCQALNSVTSGVKRIDVDDDDCLILDGDPDKPDVVENDAGNEPEELLIVGEKGQLACRDYPHSRHLCATFPFSTTPHEKYCNLCHCYACDSLAPCIYWGNGLSNTDHCHSTDKEEVWRLRRQCFKQGKTMPSPAPKQPETTLSMPVPQHNSGPAFTPLSLVNGGCVAQYSLARSNQLNPCSSAGFAMPNIISQRSNQRSGFAPQRNRVVHPVNRSQLVPCPSNSTNNVTRRVGGALGPHCTSLHSNFKRVGTPRVAVTENRSRYSSSFSNSRNYMSQLQKNRSQVKNHRTRSQDFFAGCDSQNTCQSSSQPSMGSSFVDFPPFTHSLQPQVHSQPNPVPNEDQSAYSQNACQSFSQPSMGNNFIDCLPYTGSWQPQVYSQTKPLPGEDQIAYQDEDPHPDTTALNLSNYDLSWLEDSTQCVTSSSESTIPPIQPMSEPPPVTKPISQYTSMDAPSTEVDLDSFFDSLEHQSVEATKSMLSYEFDFVPHQPDMADASLLLFDIENSKMVGTCSI